MAQTKNNLEERAMRILSAWNDSLIVQRAQRPRVKGRKRAKQREERIKSVGQKSKPLKAKALQGTYQVDRVVEEVLTSGFVATASLEQIREIVSQAADWAVFLARSEVLGHPYRRQKALRLFADLEAIQQLVSRNLELTSNDLALSTELAPAVRSALDAPFPFDGSSKHSVLRDALHASLRKHERSHP